LSNRIGLITYFSANYGSELQCYATKAFLKSQGYECDVIFEQEFGWSKILKKLYNISKIVFYSILYPGFWKNRKQITVSDKFNSTSLMKDSCFALSWFSESVLQPKGVEYRLLKQKRFCDQYQAFIAGSDQIWSGGYIVPKIMFLEFSEDDKKIALCPSFGTETIKNFNIKHFRKAISKFSHLSVREESGYKIIYNLTGKEATRISDPVMLLSATEWEAFSDKGVKLEKNYIFAHFLGKPTSTAINFMNYLSDTFGIPVLCFANAYHEYEQLKDCISLGGSPYDYVSLIKDAAFICTDSFHTSHFSIIFNKRFTTFERNYGHANCQSTRISNLFSIYKCEERFIINDICDFDKINLSYPNFDSIRKNETENIKQYLLKSLNKKNNETNSMILKSVDECTGCMACVAICPKSAISISYSDFGYRLPKIDPIKCIKCQLCHHVCYGEINSISDINPIAYISYSKNLELKMKSASGGVFSTIASAFIKKGGIVAAAKLYFENGLPKVNHILVNTIDELDSVLGSKYVESNCSQIFLPIIENVKAGNKVLFCGTSCQVKALLSFMKCQRVSFDNLFTIDLICHGVSGINFFSDYISEVNKKRKGKLTELSFREKNNGKIHFTFKGKFSTSKKDDSLFIPIIESSYYDLYMNQENYRENCYHCEFASTDKPADITIGDYFEARKDYPELFVQGAPLFNSDYINSIIVRSNKGAQLISDFGNDLFLHQVDLKRVQLSHSNLCKPSKHTHIRFNVIDAYKKKGYFGVEKMYKSITIEKKILNSIKKIITR